MKTRITKFTIGRLYNLGNYEHIRYDLTVEVPEGRSVSLALRNTMKLLRAAKPKPPVPSYEYERAKTQLADPMAWHKNITDLKERKKLIKSMLTDAKKTVQEFEAFQTRQRVAMKMLDDIGATKVHKDAKLSWDDDNDYDFEA